MMGLETAADILGGKRRLGDVLGIGERAAAHKVGGTRGVSNGDLMMTAAALDKLAARITAHAQKLRDVVASTGRPPLTPPTEIGDEFG